MPSCFLRISRRHMPILPVDTFTGGGANGDPHADQIEYLLLAMVIRVVRRAAAIRSGSEELAPIAFPGKQRGSEIIPRITGEPVDREQDPQRVGGVGRWGRGRAHRLGRATPQRARMSCDRF